MAGTGERSYAHGTGNTPRLGPIQFLWLTASSYAELSAEVLFLRKTLAFYREQEVQPRKLTDSARLSLVLWSQLFNWRPALMIVKPETLIG